MNEADTCRTYVVPALKGAGWSNEQICEQVVFTAGRIVVAGRKPRRDPQKRADYLLCLRPHYPLAVVEAKAAYLTPAQGMQQAKTYAQILGVAFAYATNGTGIVEYDFTTGIEQAVAAFPGPQALWNRLRQSKGQDPVLDDKILVPYYDSEKKPRYYQQIAINRSVEAILGGQARVLLTLATGTGKTLIAFQIAWKLWNGQWNRAGVAQRRPHILFLADRNILVDDPKDKMFAPFDKARYKIEHGQTNLDRDIYFATYQALAEDEQRPGLYRDFSPDFFDLIIVDEAHRGSARNDSSWREILDYFTGAVKLGMTATPKRDENVDTYGYFGNPIYTYSLRDGIMDGFLAPYQVRRIITDIEDGFRPFVGQTDDYGQAIPDRLYTTPDFDRRIVIRPRTAAIADHLTRYLKGTDRFAKTVVFCADQEHANEMRAALGNANADLLVQYPDYVARVTADEGADGRGHLATFQDVETRTPVILTTSKLLTTGVDMPTVRNVVLCAVINSMTEFKQIIGRGTRVREDYGKLFFTILDYTGSATQNFADPDFDGEPIEATVEEMAAQLTAPAATVAEDGNPYTPTGPQIHWHDGDDTPRKYYLSSGIAVEIINEVIYELDAEGRRQRPMQLTRYTGEQVRTLYPDLDDLRGLWAASDSRETIIAALQGVRIDLAQVANVMGQDDADPFDLLCHLAFNAAIMTRRQRAERLRRERADFLAQFGPAAREVLEAIIDQYAEYGPTQIIWPGVVELPAVAHQRTRQDVARLFGGPDPLHVALNQLQTLLYAA